MLVRMLITIKDLSKVYRVGTEDVRALDGIDLEVGFSESHDSHLQR